MKAVFIYSTFAFKFTTCTIFYAVQVDVNVYIVQKIWCIWAFRIDSDLFRLSAVFVIMSIFEDKFVVTSFVTFALIVRGYFLDRIKYQRMTTVDSTNFKELNAYFFMKFTWSYFFIDYIFER